MARVASLAGHHWALVAVTAIIVVASVVGLAQPFLRVRDHRQRAQGRPSPTCSAGRRHGRCRGCDGVLGVWQTWLATTMGSEGDAHAARPGVQPSAGAVAGLLQAHPRRRDPSRPLQDVAGLQSVATSTATSIAGQPDHRGRHRGRDGGDQLAASSPLSLSCRRRSCSTRKVALVRRDLTAAKQRALPDPQHPGRGGPQHQRTAHHTALVPHGERQFAQTSAELIDLEVRSQLAGRWRMATMGIVFAAIPAMLYLVAPPALSGGISIGTLIASRQACRPASSSRSWDLLNVGAQWAARWRCSAVSSATSTWPIEVPDPVPGALDAGSRPR